MNIDTKHHIERVIKDLEKHFNNLATPVMFAEDDDLRHKLNNASKNIAKAIVELKGCIE